MSKIRGNLVGTTMSPEKIAERIGGGGNIDIIDIIDKLCPSFAESGSVVTCAPVEGYPLGVVSNIEPFQEGSGTPTPDNIRPIQARTAVNLYRNGEEFTFPLDQTVVAGKNLLPCPYKTGSATVNGLKSVIADDGAVQFSGTPTGYAGYHFVSGLSLGKGTYTFSVSGNFSVTGVPFALIHSDEAGVQGSVTLSNQDSSTFTLDKDLNDVNIYIYMDDAAFLSGVLYPQLEAGSAATAYEPYGTASAVPAVYGGTLDWSTGILTIDKAVLQLKGTENWNYSAPKDGYCRISFAHGGTFTKDAFVCSHYVMYSSYSDNRQFPFIRANNNAATLYYEGKQDGGYFASAEEFKAFLAAQYAAGTPVQVVYKRSAPLTIQLTPQEILALAGENTLYSDAGDITVTGKADPNAVIQDLYNKLNALSDTMTALTGV